MEITANVSDPVGRRAFADIRTGQVLLSIVTRERGSAVLQASGIDNLCSRTTARE